VQDYTLAATNGLGLVFIVERLVSRTVSEPFGSHHAERRTRHSHAGEVWVVFFDVATRRVVSAKKEIHSVASGSNFRNFWFGPIKDADETLGRYRGMGGRQN
jgi:hypothetical protein